MPTLNLPTAGGKIAPYTTQPPRAIPGRRRRRSAASPMRRRMSSPIRSPTAIPGSTPRSTGTRTIAFRRHLWSLGLGVAEAMDTAQRGMGMDWPNSLELIRRSSMPRRTSPARCSARAPAPIISTPRAERDDRRRHPRLRGAMRGDRKARRPHHPDGEPRAGEGGALARRLRPGLRPHPRPGEGAGDHPLARRDVRSRARRLLGLRGPSTPRWRSRSTSSPPMPPRSTA